MNFTCPLAYQDEPGRYNYKIALEQSPRYHVPRGGAGPTGRRIATPTGVSQLEEYEPASGGPALVEEMPLWARLAGQLSGTMLPVRLG